MNKPSTPNTDNPTGEQYHAPHAPKPPHSLNDPLQTITPNPPGAAAGPVLNQDPKFGNLTPDEVAARQQGRTADPDGTYHAADGTRRNINDTDARDRRGVDGQRGDRNPDGTQRR